jgi:2-amino-4-hydroxy-6-hydroxymethyldihydropteridine diphosphokinase
MQESHTVYLALGTNLGDTNLNLLTAIGWIAERIGIFSAISPVYETEAWGFVSGNLFLNMVVRVETNLLPLDLLKATQSIEKVMGRNKKTTNHSYQDRIIDIDIIFYDDWVYQSEELTIPHPHYQDRAFVTEPLKAIADFVY